MAQRAVRDVRAWRAGLVAKLALPRAEPTELRVKVVVACYMVDGPTAKDGSLLLCKHAQRALVLVGWRVEVVAATDCIARMHCERAAAGRESTELLQHG